MFTYARDDRFVYTTNALGGGELIDRELGSTFIDTENGCGDLIASTQFLDISAPPGLGCNSGEYLMPSSSDGSDTRFVVPPSEYFGQLEPPEYFVNSLEPTTYESPFPIGSASEVYPDYFYELPPEPFGTPHLRTIELVSSSVFDDMNLPYSIPCSESRFELQHPQAQVFQPSSNQGDNYNYGLFRPDSENSIGIDKNVNHEVSGSVASEWAKKFDGYDCTCVGDGWYCQFCREWEQACFIMSLNQSGIALHWKDVFGSYVE